MTQDQPIVFFGLGAMKAGTSWLHDALKAHEGVHFRGLKELHYFSMFDQGYVQQRKARIEMLMARADARMPALAPDKKASLEQTQQDRADFLELLELGAVDNAAYLAFLRKGAGPDTRVIGEITPLYATLSVARLRQMAAIAPVTKFIYVLRDPVARMWSQLRMEGKRTGVDTTDHAAFAAAVAKLLEHELEDGTLRVLERSDYRAALTRFRDAIPDGDLLVMFYEDMLSQQGANRIFDFLGLPRRTVDADRRVHGGATLDMTGHQRAQLRSQLADQYDFIASEFGNVPEAWMHNTAAGAA